MVKERPAPKYVSAQGQNWLRVTRAGSKAREGGKLEVTQSLTKCVDAETHKARSLLRNKCDCEAVTWISLTFSSVPLSDFYIFSIFSFSVTFDNI